MGNDAVVYKREYNTWYPSKPSFNLVLSAGVRVCFIRGLCMDCIWYNGLYTCTPRVSSRQASKINLFGLHYCVICCEVETKYISHRKTAQ